jgi:tellurite resistance protein TerC
MLSVARVKRVAVAILGGTVLLVGVALLVLPGPAFLVIPAGLAILALEFAWAKRWLDKARGLVKRKEKGHEQTRSNRFDHSI